jgi:membrane-bound serine protease (ClpP class)
MCHIILALPVLTLPIFLIWPLRIAAPVYAVIVVFSFAVYSLLLRSMRKPVSTGREELLHETAIVERAAGPNTYWVRVHGEEWKARGTEAGFRTGDEVRIVGLEGLTLRIARQEAGVDPTPRA